MITKCIKVLRGFGGLFYVFKMVLKSLCMSSLFDYKSNMYHNLIEYYLGFLF